MKWLHGKNFFVFCLLLFCASLLYSETLLKWAYPIHYQEEILDSSQQYQIDPLLIAALIRVESNFKPSQASKKGAIGVMQLMPSTANWIIQKANTPHFTIEDILHSPNKNIQLGTWYVQWLLNKYQGNYVAALAAYNAGPTSVYRWINTGVWDGKINSLNKIPYGETRHFVQRVVHYYETYQKLYKNELARG